MGNALRWKSLRMKLLLGITLGLVPLIAIWILVYSQSVQELKGVVTDSAEREHARFLELVQERLRGIESAARSLGNDPRVQQLLEQGPPVRTDGEQELREYVNYALRREQEGRTAIAELCLQQINPGRSYCYGTAQSTGFGPAEDAGQQLAAPEPGRMAGANTGGEQREPSGVQGTGGAASAKDATATVPSPSAGEKIGSFRLLYSSTANPATEAGQIQYVMPVAGTSAVAPVGAVVVKVSFTELMAAAKNQGFQWANRFVTDRQGRLLYADKPVLSGAVAGKEQPVSALQMEYGDLSFTSHMQFAENGFQSVIRPVRWLMITLAGLLLVLVACVSIQLSFLVTKPLRQLRLLMKRAERGDLKAYWVSSGSQELNELGESYNQMLNRLEDLIRRVKEEEGLKKEAEIEALHYQLNPHFLYNTLNTIKWVAKIHKTPQIADAVNALVRLLQASVGKKGDFITVSEELSLVQDYMAIQSFRYGEKSMLVLQVDPASEGCLVPRLLLQPLVENAIIHGIEPSRKEGQITVRIWLERDLLFCQVSDNGVGLSEERHSAVWNDESRRQPHEGGQAPVLREAMSGIGLRNIRDRIRLYYGADYKVQMISKPAEGTTVRLTLPVHHSEGEAG